MILLINRPRREEKSLWMSVPGEANGLSGASGESGLSGKGKLWASCVSVSEGGNVSVGVGIMVGVGSSGRLQANRIIKEEKNTVKRKSCLKVC